MATRSTVTYLSRVRFNRTVRVLGALTALWSLVASGSPVPLHRCAGMVGAVTRQAVASHHAAPKQAASVSHAGHHLMATATDQEQAPVRPDDEDCGCCRCLACGCTATAVGLPSLALVTEVASDVAVQVADFVAPEAPKAARTPHALPFGNGPPAV